MRVLIGFDGSESSDAMLEDLNRAGLPRVCDAKVVTVTDLLMGKPQAKAAAAETAGAGRIGGALERMGSRAEQISAAANGHAERAADLLGLQFPEWNISHEVLSGTPAWELIEAGENWNADLIVVGSNARSLFGRLLLGSVSKTVVTDSQRSVRVSRPGRRVDAAAAPRVMVGIDGTPASRAAVEAVGSRVWDDGTHVHLVAVRDQHPPARIARLMPKAADMVSDANQTAVKAQDELLDWAYFQLKSIGITTTMSIQRGDAKRILLKAAERHRADSIFVGTREFKNSLERFRLGSVSSGILMNAGCSVEVIRPIAADES